jgi:F-type H+-transporting ATPase subunit c
MNLFRVLMLMVLGSIASLSLVAPAQAQAPPSEFLQVQSSDLPDEVKEEFNNNQRAFGIGLRAIGIGLAVLGAGLGIGILAKATVESYARQPEMQGPIFIAFLLAAALIEGIGFAALVFVAVVM